MARRRREPGTGTGPSPEERLERMSALQLIDLISEHLAIQEKPPTRYVRHLRNRVEELEDIRDQAEGALSELNDAVEKLRAPALRLGTLLHRIGNERALVCVGGGEYVCNVDPLLPDAVLEGGMRVLLNEAYAVTDSFGLDKSGPVVRLTEVLPDGRIRVGQDAGITDTVVVRADALRKEALKPGMDLRLDANQRVAVEIVAPARRFDRSLSTVEPIPWSDIGGQDAAVQAIRDSIEMPILHANLFKRFEHPVPKGFLLYGPPGCGKTLLGKATAHNLRRQIQTETGEDRPEFFISVKGPEILNMWVGESERQVRELFSQCRDKAEEGYLVFLFIDEAESVLGTRHGGRVGNAIISTLVPMFCAEMDGMEALRNVVVILASNRADLIDPAILRPGRIDRKIRVRRPNREAGREIYGIYLNERLPLAEDRRKLIDAVTEAHFAETEENRFLEIAYRSGRREFLHRGDLASGAIIAAIVERAKELAIKRSVLSGAESGITREDLLTAFEREYRENELFPPTDITEDWLKLTDFDPQNVVRLTPYRLRHDAERRGSI